MAALLDATFGLLIKSCQVTVADLKEGSNWRRLSEDKILGSRLCTVVADFTDPKSFELLRGSF